MNDDQFLKRCPVLTHVGPVGVWDAIQRDGFRTAQQLIDAADLTDDERRDLVEVPRPEQVTLKVDGHEAVLRDQAPLAGRADAEALFEPGVTMREWLSLLNRRTFFFVDAVAEQKFVDRFLPTDGAVEVLKVSPARFLAAARGRIELTAQNTAAVVRVKGSPKGPRTFLPVRQFPDKKPKEVTVLGSLEADVVVRAFRRHADGSEEHLFP